MSEEKTEVGAADDTAAPAEQSADEIWAEIQAGKQAPQDDDQVTSGETSDDDPGEAATRDSETAPADEAGSEQGEGGAKTDHIEQLREKDKRQRGVISSKDREIRRLREEMAQFAKDKGTAKKPESWEKLREIYPDITDPMEERLAALQTQLDRLSKGLQTSAELESERTKAFYDQQDALVSERVPDWQRMVGAARDMDKREAEAAARQFWSWVESPEQSVWVRDAAKAMTDGFDDVDTAADLLSLYKQHLDGRSGAQPGSQEPESKQALARQRRLDGARTVPTRGSQRATATPRPDESDPDALWKAIVAKRKGAS